MKAPRMSDKELSREAEALHRQGELSIRRLRARAGGGDTERLMRVVRAVREAETNSNAHACVTSPYGAHSEATLLPKALEDEFARLKAAVCSQIEAVRAREIERARAAEGAAAGRHEAEMAAAATELALLREDVADLEQSVTGHSVEIERLTAAWGVAEKALARTEEECRAAAQVHVRERLALTESAAALQTLVAQASEARDTAKAELRRAVADGTRLGSELDRERIASAELRARLEESERRRAAAEQARNDAVARQEELAGRIDESADQLRASMLEAATLRGHVEAHRTVMALLKQAKKALATRAGARSEDCWDQQLELPADNA